MLKSLSARVLIGLLAGLLIGAWIQASGDARLREGAELFSSIGGVWLNALRMTVIPLLFAILVTGIASVSDAMATGRLATRALMLFTLLLLAAAIYSVALTSGLLALWPIDPQAAQNFLAGVHPDETQVIAAPDLAQWLQALIPPNPIRAAADDAVLPLVVFALFFGFAATRLPLAQREPLVNIIRALAETMIVIVHWVLLVGPVGVFALALGVGLNAGFGAAGVLVHYTAIVTFVTFTMTPIAVALAILWGREPLTRFVAAATPVWAIAFSTQSSLASLPAMVESARGPLAIPARITDLVLPLAVAVFRFTSPVANLAVALFMAALYGLEPSLMQLAAAVAVAYAVSIAAVGLPGQVSFFTSMAPICLTLGLPLELLGVLIAVEVIPDIWRTVGNVTGDLTATTILRREKLAPAPLAAD